MMIAMMLTLSFSAFSMETECSNLKEIKVEQSLRDWNWSDCSQDCSEMASDQCSDIPGGVSWEACYYSAFSGCMSVCVPNGGFND